MRLTLPATVTFAQAAALARGLSEQSRSASGEVTLDATALEVFDSSVLSVLLQCRRDATARGQKWATVGLPERLRQLAQLYGISELFEPAH